MRNPIRRSVSIPCTFYRSYGPFHCYRSNGTSHSLLLLLEQWSVFILFSCYRSDGPSPFPAIAIGTMVRFIAIGVMVRLHSLLLLSERWSVSIPYSCYESNGLSQFAALASGAMVRLQSLLLSFFFLSFWACRIRFLL